MARRKSNRNGSALPWLIAGGAGVALYYLYRRPQRRLRARQDVLIAEGAIAVDAAEEVLTTQIEEAQGISRGAALRIAKSAIRRARLGQIDNPAFQLLLIDKLVARGVPRARARAIVGRLVRLRQERQASEDASDATVFTILPKRQLPQGPKQSSMSDSPSQMWSGEGTINYDVTTKGTMVPGARTIFH